MQRATLHILTAVLISYCVLSPFTFSTDYATGWRLGTTWNFSDAALNIGLFLPFGFLIASQPFLAQLPIAIRLLFTVFSAFLFSAALEYSQLFLPRVSSYSDIAANVLGAVLGSLIYMCIRPLLETRWFHTEGTRMLHSLALSVFAILLSVTAYIVLVPHKLAADLSNWHPGFLFSVGNESNLQAPWLGTLYSLGVYDRALTPDTVYQQFQLGLAANEKRTDERYARIAFYAFNEGEGAVIRNGSLLTDETLDLNVMHPDRVSWVSQAGLKLIDNTVLRPKSTVPISNHLASSEGGQMAVELWLKPERTQQFGPARIVTLSWGDNARNFMLGQNGSDLEFYLRSPVSGSFGAKPLTIAPNVFAAPPNEATHIVATVKAGQASVYVNGLQAAHTDYTAIKRNLYEQFIFNNKQKSANVVWVALFLPFVFLGFCLNMKVAKGMASCILVILSLAVSFFILLLHQLILGHQLGSTQFQLMNAVCFLSLLYGVCIRQLLNQVQPSYE